MSLAHGRDLLAIPGPSVIPERVLNAMHQAAPNIYEGELIDITATIRTDLLKVARTKHDVAIYIANGHGAWEAAVANTLSPGDHALVLATGRFAKGWAIIAEAMGVQVEMLDFGTASPVDSDRLAARLKGDTKIKAVLTVQTDTASSVINDIAGIRAAIDSAGHDALLMVDCIASLACDQYEMDTWGVDVTVAACQKGLMTPPGLGFVFMNDKAKAVRSDMTAVSSYWDWAPRVAPEMYYQYFCGTAPTHHLFGLRAALDMLLDEGIENVWSRHKTHASAVWAAIDAWGAAGEIRCNIVDPTQRSTAVTAIHTGAGDAKRLRKWCEDAAGLTLGIGLSPDTAKGRGGDSLFRIGHMGHLNPPMLLGTLATIDAGLKSLGIAHGTGALEAAALVVAGH